MAVDDKLITFGPVPSRRLGHSLGVNNIPPKLCSYSCIYCQLGRTLNMQVERRAFYKSEDILKAVEKRVKDAEARKESIDYLTFVPDGEPTLDINLGTEIKMLKTLGIKTAVISNASLIWENEVRDALYGADWVSMKIDAVTGDIWRRVNRPHRTLQLDAIFRGIKDFFSLFKGIPATETMLIKDLNDREEELEKISAFIASIGNTKSYISVPIRPPAEKKAISPEEPVINTAYQIFRDKGIDTECLVGYEGNSFAFTGNVEEDLLSITSVHPMKDEAVDAFLEKAGAGREVVAKLVGEKKLVATEYKGSAFYIRKLVRYKPETS